MTAKLHIFAELEKRLVWISPLPKSARRHASPENPNRLPTTGHTDSGKVFYDYNNFQKKSYNNPDTATVPSVMEPPLHRRQPDTRQTQRYENHKPYLIKVMIFRIYFRLGIFFMDRIYLRSDDPDRLVTH
jgi:hypothetical protein